MSFHQMTHLVGLTQNSQTQYSTIRAARGVFGLLIAFLGLLLVFTQALPLLWFAVNTVLSNPASLRAVELSAMAGAATGLGAIALLVMKKIDDQGLGLFISIAGGMMAAAALFLFLPAVQTKGAHTVALLAALAGYGTLLLLDQVLPHQHPVPGVPQAGAQRKRTAILMTIAIGLHNVPEGFAVGASAANLDGATGTALSIGLQNLPEGLIVATALWSIGIHKAWAALAALATGLVEPFGAGLGALAVQEWAQGTPAAMAFAAGAMAFVVIHEMIPESIQMTGKLKSIYVAGVSTVFTAIALGWMGG